MLVSVRRESATRIFVGLYGVRARDTDDDTQADTEAYTADAGAHVVADDASSARFV